MRAWLFQHLTVSIGSDVSPGLGLEGQVLGLGFGLEDKILANITEYQPKQLLPVYQGRNCRLVYRPTGAIGVQNMLQP